MAVTDSTTVRANDRLARIYAYVVDEEDARVCRDIPDTACHWVPYNFFANIVASTLSKVGDEIANPKTLLTWVMSFVAAPVALVGLLVPIRESGSLIPQLVIAAWVRQLARRKWVWVIGSVVQGAAMVGIGAVAWTLEGAAAGWAIIGLLVVFSLARGLCSVAHKDVVGKTIPKTRRGRLGGWSAAAAGAVALLVGVFLATPGTGGDDAAFYGALIAAAGCAWFAAAAAFATVQEDPGATEGGGNALAEALRRLALLRDDRDFARFVLVRALFLVSALSAPYYMVLATDIGGADALSLGLFIIANGLASTVSAPIWGRMADRSSKQVMLRAATLASVLGIVVFAWAVVSPDAWESAWIYAAAFLVLGVAHNGARLGRKTYIVDMAGGSKRVDYVAVSNSVIGVVLLASGLLGVLAALISPVGVILVFALLGLFGVALGRRLPDVQ